MYTYSIVKNGKLIQSYESDHYVNFKRFIPDGYIWVVVSNSPGMVAIEVETDYELYRMEF